MVVTFPARTLLNSKSICNCSANLIRLPSKSRWCRKENLRQNLFLSLKLALRKILMGKVCLQLLSPLFWIPFLATSPFAPGSYFLHTALKLPQWPPKLPLLQNSLHSGRDSYNVIPTPLVLLFTVREKVHLLHSISSLFTCRKGYLVTYLIISL